MEYEKLTLEEKIALAYRLKADGITCRTINVQNDKSSIFNIQWRNVSDTPCHKPLQQKIIDLADYLTFNYRDKAVRRNKTKYITFSRRSEVPASIDDQYREIVEMLVRAVAPYADDAKEKWMNYEQIRMKAKCVFCRHYSGCKCNNPDSCRFGDYVGENYNCSCYCERGDDQ